MHKSDFVTSNALHSFNNTLGNCTSQYVIFPLNGLATKSQEPLKVLNLNDIVVMVDLKAS